MQTEFHMAEQNTRPEGNVPRKFYVDANCISCGLCCDMVPEFFEMNSETGLSVVKQQPDTPESIEKCEEAMNSCPVGSIQKES